MESPRAHGAVENTRGFTLVELIVVLAIIIIITTLTITSQSDYNRSLIITNTAYTVALSIREAQSLGLSSRAFTANDGSVTQNAAYGVHFSDTNMTQYRVFADIRGPAQGEPSYSGCPTGLANTPEFKPGNCRYDNTSEILTTFNLNKGFSIYGFCGIRTSNGSSACSNHSTWEGLNITYLRPNTEAIISMVTTANGTHPLNCAVIWVLPPGNAMDKMKCVVVSQVGQVSVPQTCPAYPLTACP